jgi:hypothetical protein
MIDSRGLENVLISEVFFMKSWKDQEYDPTMWKKGHVKAEH